MQTLRDIHQFGAYVLIIVCGISGLWLTAAHWAEALRHRSMWWLTNVSHVVVVVVVAAGSLNVGLNDIEADGTHMFYGFLTFASVGVIIGYRHLSQYRYLLYGLGGLFIMGLGIRGVFLDPAV